MLSQTRTKQVIHKGYTVTVVVSYSSVRKGIDSFGRFNIGCSVIAKDGTSMPEFEVTNTVHDEFLTKEKLMEEINDVFKEVIARIDKPPFGLVEQFLIDNGFE